MPTRCAVYCRYSSDQQRPESNADQLRHCRQDAARQHSKQQGGTETLHQGATSNGTDEECTSGSLSATEDGAARI